ncbi:MAG: ribonucleoside-diphosphate reductase, adenosylcobalamin-dependent [Deltaproteobacteria bacterium RIFOXYA12_FULL_58_15]|nr:MAG: ribonucleoside-diphosphate reductase, adenosylcobalamin-dependent [Deltaproteobacteria bacterium RIFOXYA12_FULL_58_15]OGR11695.1 MAG: ribonucleoside-diphosphate reductase, adenosylcobalamin-dependent [Deltaproteobacteria bacterium RIFOXYB12_FULL_58_9]
MGDQISGTLPFGLTMPRRWTTAGVDPFDQVEWETRSAVISGGKGQIIFEQKNVEIPASWSQLATNVVVSKYFRGVLGTKEREFSVRQLVGRVVDTIARWADEGNYFAKVADVEAFRDELKYLLLHQYAAFNSPVWFNVGVETHPQCSACFINSVEDTMDSILELSKTEGRLFKFGSGTGTNLSPLRGSTELLAGGGLASGPVSFMKGYDAFAGVIKSGGKTRRAAKMVILNIDHPDIEIFINCKAKEEKKAWALIDAGYDGAVDGEAYGSVFFQNSNNSVRVNDEFMHAVESDGVWKTINRVDGAVAGSFEAKRLMQSIAEATHLCGDPGLQFDSTINKWHTCKATDRIYGSNPCSEYMFLNDSACNLASLNLMKFRDVSGDFNVEGFKHAVDVVFTAQEVVIDNAGYPTEKIGRNSRRFRPLGLGYANLGALLMSRGLPYDSDGGRAYAAVVTALMTGEAYAQSARLAKVKGAFEGYEENRESMLDVIAMHRDSLSGIDEDQVPPSLFSASAAAWDDALALGERHGYRNAQATVLAPTGTIGFMMDCDTTGIEPDISLIKYKKLVGGGLLKIVNGTVPEALDRMGFTNGHKAAILDHLEKEETIEGAPYLEPEHLEVFDCAFKPLNGKRSISPMGHVRMMAAVQPFISGAISKTVNLAEEATAEEISRVYTDAWKLGIKSIALYRDNCKRSQPLNTSAKGAVDKNTGVQPARRRLSDERVAITHKFSIAGHEGYITVGLYEDGLPGEVFITMSKEGSTISGLMDSLATAISLALQYGVPLKVLCDKFSHTRYEPSGFTGNRDIPIAKSITDYIFRWLGLKFLTAKDIPAPPAVNLSSNVMQTMESPTAAARAREKIVFSNQADAPTCVDCGSLMVRNGACYKCSNCGSTSGCS